MSLQHAAPTPSRKPTKTLVCVGGWMGGHPAAWLCGSVLKGLSEEINSTTRKHFPYLNKAGPSSNDEDGRP